MKKKTELEKAHYQYNKASHRLWVARDKAFPIGSKCKSKWSEHSPIYTVKSGSLYPDQVYTDYGHFSPHSLELVE